ncbi:methyl-accepting chemotaxis protein [Leadbettera azotonutricia]|uniref:Methyl-accepting chemotaxis protein n=1 Tax=Leadbettera azotonutricia (strain ATCC BAA-888 / DSM 13862 / ZAS-9) TaxID=545695 RepID=F5Y8S9_LEAAZ|nr:methyl-accepting chemotaxis protein [Leadbettera azotonutricia]AEF82555.1 methyl-accepting chemotaxis protein [Leadbettera azotonutricia ZAS-9]
MKLKFRLTLIMVALVVVVVGVISVVLLFRASSMQGKSAREILEYQTGMYAKLLQARYEVYYDTVQTLCQVFNGYEDVPVENRREQYDDMLKSVLDSNANFVSLFTIWKPGVIDGNDAAYANTPGSDESGNYITMYTRQSGTVEKKAYIEWRPLIAALDSTPDMSNPVYTTVAGQKAIVGDIRVPIIRDKDNAVIGLIGVQMNYNASQEVVLGIIPYNSPKGSAGLYANDGTIVAHHVAARIGEKFQTASLGTLGAQGVKDIEDISLKGGKPVMVESNGLFIESYPFVVGKTTLPWTVTAIIDTGTVLADVTAMERFAVILVIIAVILSVIIVFFVATLIVKPILNVTLTLKDISEGEGDLTKTIDIKGNDEIADLSKFFNATLKKIRDLVATIKKQAAALFDIGNELAANMTETAAAINEITANIQSIKGRVINQSASVTETNATMEQITVNIDKLNGHVDKQTESVAQSSSAIEQMLANIQSVTTTLIKNAENVKNLTDASEMGRGGLQEVATDIQEISKESEGLLEINAVMENIASQTNLLSMNAAIEAAHAGEAGKGFAVVADEIRKLAENSGEQSKTISNVLKKIKESIDKISKSTDAVLNKFESIDSGVKTVADQEENIRNAMEEQSEGSKQILEAVAKMNEITQQVKGGSEEMLEGSKQVIAEGKNLEMATQEITNGMNEMATGADQINIAVNQVNTISGNNKDNIDILVREVSRFKID